MYILYKGTVLKRNKMGLGNYNNKKTWVVIDTDGRLIDTFRLRVSANRCCRVGQKVITYEEYLQRCKEVSKQNGNNNRKC